MKTKAIIVGVIFSCAAQGAVLDLQREIDAAAAKGGADVRRPRNITLRNVTLTVPGGGTEAEARASVPEKDRAYPEAFMFNQMALPAYGFYVRHADNVVFDNVDVRTVKPDARPRLVVEDGTFVQK